MSTFNTLAPYVASANSEYDGFILTAGVVGAVFALVVLFAVPAFRRHRSDLPGVFILVPVAVGAISLLLAVTVASTIASSEHREHRAAYASDVRTWLNDEYGVKATAAESESLARGGKLAVASDTTLTTVHIVPVAGGTVALVDEEGALFTG